MFIHYHHLISTPYECCSFSVCMCVCANFSALRQEKLYIFFVSSRLRRRWLIDNAPASGTIRSMVCECVHVFITRVRAPEAQSRFMFYTSTDAARVLICLAFDLRMCLCLILFLFLWWVNAATTNYAVKMLLGMHGF